MKIEVRTDTVPWRYSPEARLREQTRMAILCWCLRTLGRKAWCRELPAAREDWFGDIRGTGEPDVSVVAAESLMFVRGTTVGFKTSTSILDDERLAAAYPVLMAHKHSMSVVDTDSLLPVELMVSDAVLEWLHGQGLLHSYLSDYLDAVRSAVEVSKQHRLGFAGTSHYGRSNALQQLPDDTVAHLYGEPNTEPLPVAEYLSFLASCEMGLDIPGETPKCYRSSELRMLGVPVVTVPQGLRSGPAIDRNNTVLLSCWKDHAAIDGAYNRLWSIRDHSDAAYQEGWSPLGQARQLIHRLERMP